MLRRLQLFLIVTFLVGLAACGSSGSTPITNPVPTISASNATSPSSVVAGSGAFNLTVNGSGFVSSSQVQWNGSGRVTTFVSGMQLKAAITAADVASPGTASITVVSPPPGGGTSNAFSFSITGAAPSITQLSPTSGPVGTAVTITGTNFGATQGTSTVKFNGTTATTITNWSTTSIVATVPTGATTGNVVVTVGGVGSNGVGFTVTFALTVTEAGTGSGTVTSSPAGINCPGTCTANYNSGTVVTLTASAGSGSTFAGWSGACSGTGTCSVTMSAAKSVTATFNNPTMFGLAVTEAGTGSGTVTSSPAGINCPGTCTANYNGGTVVTLTAAAGSGSTFAGWSGACSGTGTCSVTMSAAKSVTATFNTTQFGLTVTEAGTGSGTVTSSPAGINCPGTCTANYNSGTVVTLTAAAGSGSTFAGWSGACSGTGTCGVTMSAAKSVTATFNTTQFGLTVTEAGTGSGTVTSSPAGINCPGTCTANYNGGTVVTLTAAAGSGSTFAGWSGACSGTGTCSVTMSAAKSVTATFNNPTMFGLAVTEAGTGSGTVTSSPAGINCPGTCTANYNSGTVVTLTAAAGSGSTFAGWSGACSGTGTCSVTMSAAKSVTATFNNPTMFGLAVTEAGTGSGTVTSSPAGINCPGTCTANYNGGTVVTLTAAAGSGSTFAGWSGACSGTGTCSVTMSAAKSVTATFNTTQFGLTVTEAGTGSGTVTSSPAGINCPGTCTANYNSGTVVTLTAAAGSGSTFAGWSGACSGTGTCSVTMSAAKSVTATFNTTQFGLTVTEAGTGSGTVTSSPAGINCPGTCTANYNGGTVVTLTAAAGSGSTFAGWSGACSGTGTCSVTMSAAKSVTATFNTTQFGLTVTEAGTGSGTVTSSPAGINCPGTCTANYNSGTVVTLTAAAGSGSTFAGWSGACSGTGTCSVTMSAAKSVTATFNTTQFGLTVTEAGTGSGTVTSSPAGINCPGTCTANYNSGTVVTLTAAAGSGSTFAGWSGSGCSGTGTCVVTMSAAKSVTATFSAGSTLTSISPTTIGAGTPGFLLTVSGTNFSNGGSVVNFNGVGLSTTFVNATTLTAIVPHGDIASAGSGSITVSAAAGTQTLTIESAVTIVQDSSLSITGLSMPVRIAFAPDGALFVAEQFVLASGTTYDGVIKRVTISGGVGTVSTWASFVVDASSFYHGLLGMAIDPANPPTASGGSVYVFYTNAAVGDNRIAKVAFGGGIATEVTGLPVAQSPPDQGWLNGGKILVQTDPATGKTYVYASTGGSDANDAYSQNITESTTGWLYGKILRYNTDLTIPSDNPFGSANPIYACGFRNSFGFDFHPTSGALYASDNGNEGGGSPPFTWHDSLDRVVAGDAAGYGFTSSNHCQSSVTSPLWGGGSADAPTEIAPTGTIFYTGTAIPQLQNTVLITGDNLNQIYQYAVDEYGSPAGNLLTAPTSIVTFTSFGLTDLAQGPDGCVYAAVEGSNAIVRMKGTAACQ